MASWVAVVGTIAGTFVDVLATLKVSRDARQAARRAEIRRAFAAYVGALYGVVAELRDMPSARRVGDHLGFFDRLRSEEARWLLTRRRLRSTFGDRPQELMDRVAVAIANLQTLPISEDLRQVVDGTNNYLEALAAKRTSMLKREWPSVHQRLMEAAKSL